MTDYAAAGAAILLMYGVVPVWIAAGAADYFCHRATSIQTTSGTTESVLHLLQFALVGIPVTLALFLRANAGYFALALICILVHHAVAALDLMYADARRRVAPREQMVHSFLEIMPVTALLLLGVLNWSQLSALFGHGPEAARFAPEVRMLPLPYVIAVLGAAFLFNLLPYFEELVRCMRARRRA
jgi:hypothetical protein